MSTLANTFKSNTKKNTSNKNPAWYNREKNRLIKELSIDSCIEVRSAIAANTHTPTKVLTSMLDTEQSKDVLRLVLMNPNIPRKAVQTFVKDESDERVTWFDEDAELIAHFKQESSDESSDDDNTSDDQSEE